MNFEDFFEALLELFTTIGLKVLYAILILFVGLKLIKWLKKKLPSFPFMERLDTGLRTFLCSTAAILLYALLFISVYGIMSGGNYGDTVCECRPAPRKDCPFKEGSLIDTVDKASKEFEDYVDRKEHELGHRMRPFMPGKGKEGGQ